MPVGTIVKRKCVIYVPRVYRLTFAPQPSSRPPFLVPLWERHCFQWSPSCDGGWGHCAKAVTGDFSLILCGVCAGPQGACAPGLSWSPGLLLLVLASASAPGQIVSDTGSCKVVTFSTLSPPSYAS